MRVAMMKKYKGWIIYLKNNTASPGLSIIMVPGPNLLLNSFTVNSSCPLTGLRLIQY